MANSELKEFKKMCKELGFKVSGTELKKYKGEATSVEIPDGITCIGKGAFSKNKILESVIIPSSVTTIKKNAFDGCESLKSVEIPEGVTMIESCTFHECTSLEHVSLPSNLNLISSSAFYSCKSLRAVEIPNTVTHIGLGAFRFCESLTSVKIPENVLMMERCVFQCCSSLEEILVDENNPQYMSIDGVVYSKNGEAFVQYPAGKKCANFIIPSKVTEIVSASFACAKQVSVVTIPNGVKKVGYNAFVGCSNTTINCQVKKPPLELPEGFDKEWLGYSPKPKVNWLNK